MTLPCMDQPCRYTNTSYIVGSKLGGVGMVEAMLIDLKALLVEREDCDAGTVQQLRNALAQGGSQYRTLRDVTDLLQKKLESNTGVAAKRWHLKLGVALYFQGRTADA